MAGDVIGRTMADLAAHPGTTATQIGDRLDVHNHIVFQVLETLEQAGQAQRSRNGGRAWQWEAVTTGENQFTTDPPSPTGCPACGSDDYEVLETGPDGPDYDGPKRCESCGEEWT